MYIVCYELYRIEHEIYIIYKKQNINYGKNIAIYVIIISEVILWKKLYHLLIWL